MPRVKTKKATRSRYKKIASRPSARQKKRGKIWATYRRPLILASLLPLVWFGGFYVYDLVCQDIVPLTQWSGLTLEEVLVEGRQRTAQEDVLKAVPLKQGESLFSTSPRTIQHNLQKLMWVQSAVVERRLPHTIYIRIAERTPTVIWQLKGKQLLLDQNTKVIPCQPREIPRDLLTIVGERAPENFKKIMTLFAHFPHLQPRVIAATCLRSGRWDLHLSNQWILKMPEEKIDDAITRFLAFEKKYPPAKNKKFIVDLRMPDSLFFQEKT